MSQEIINELHKVRDELLEFKKQIQKCIPENKTPIKVFGSSQGSSSSNRSLENCRAICQSASRIIEAYSQEKLSLMFLKAVLNEITELSGHFSDQKNILSSEEKDKQLKALGKNIERLDRLAKSLEGTEVFYDIEDSEDTSELNTSTTNNTDENKKRCVLM